MANIDRLTGVGTKMIRVDCNLHDEIGKLRELDESYADALRKLIRQRGGR